jgi:hypothetical protein
MMAVGQESQAMGAWYRRGALAMLAMRQADAAALWQAKRLSRVFGRLRRLQREFVAVLFMWAGRPSAGQQKHDAIKKIAIKVH